MACQSNPNTYAIVFRCPLEDGARLKSLAEKAGKTVSMYVAGMVKDRVGNANLNDEEKAWIEEHLEMNRARRARADKMTANGYFKRKRRGRPRKPGPRKGSKHKVKILGAET